MQDVQLPPADHAQLYGHFRQMREEVKLTAAGNSYRCGMAAHGEVDRVVEHIQRVRRDSGSSSAGL